MSTEYNSNRFQEVLNRALEEMTDAFSDSGDDRDATADKISEIADSHVPVYNWERIECLDDSRVSSAEPDAGLFEGVDLFQTIGVYIFTALEEALYEELDRLDILQREKQDQEDEEESDDE